MIWILTKKINLPTLFSLNSPDINIEYLLHITRHPVESLVQIIINNIISFISVAQADCISIFTLSDFGRSRKGPKKLSFLNM